MTSEIYPFPPLVEVAFEINFLPKLKVIEKIPDLQAKINVDFPKYQEETPLFPPSPQGFGRPDHSKYSIRYVFLDERENKLLRVGTDHFNIVSRAYISFEDLKRSIASLWTTFEEIMEGFSAKRIGLRFINRLRLPLTNNRLDILNYTQPYMEIERIGTTQLIACSVELRLDLEDSKMTVRSGLLDVETENDESYGIYLLDYDCYQTNPKAVTNLTATLDRMHGCIEARFNEDIKESYRVYMRTGKWDTKA